MTPGRVDPSSEWDTAPLTYQASPVALQTFVALLRTAGRVPPSGDVSAGRKGVGALAGWIIEVLGGRRTGDRIALAAGSSVLGRLSGVATVVLDDDGVSRRHAALEVAGGTISVEDLGSTNGTWVNGRRISERTALHPGDQLVLGAVELAVELAGQAGDAHPGRAPGTAVGPAPVAGKNVRVVRAALVGGVVELVLLAAGVAVQKIGGWTGLGPWLAVPLLGTVSALVQVAKDAATRPTTSTAPAATPHAGTERVRRAPGPGVPPRGRVSHATDRERHRAGTSSLVAVLVVIVLIGGVGALATWGVAKVTAYTTGNQPGVERLLEPATVVSSDVTATVTSVLQTADFTRVSLTVRNDLADSISLPLFELATFSSADGAATLDADTRRSRWSDTIAPRQVRYGVLVFRGSVGSGTVEATLAFATVFGGGFDGPDSLVVAVHLAPAPGD